MITRDGQDGLRMEFLELYRSREDRSDKHFYRSIPCQQGLRIRAVYRALPEAPFLPRLFDHDCRDQNGFTFEYLGETHIPVEVFLIRARSYGNTSLIAAFQASLEGAFCALLEKGFYFEQLEVDKILVEKTTGQVKIFDFSECSRRVDSGEDESALAPLGGTDGSPRVSDPPTSPALFPESYAKVMIDQAIGEILSRCHLWIPHKE